MKAYHRVPWETTTVFLSLCSPSHSLSCTIYSLGESLSPLPTLYHAPLTVMSLPGLTVHDESSSTSPTSIMHHLVFAILCGPSLSSIMHHSQWWVSVAPPRPPLTVFMSLHFPPSFMYHSQSSWVSPHRYLYHAPLTCTVFLSLLNPRNTWCLSSRIFPCI